jgi:glucose 1-dehydrogenase
VIDLNGHSVLITGSTQGVGRAIAVACAHAGARVTLHGLRDDLAAQEALAEVRSHDPSASLITSDLIGERPNSNAASSSHVAMSYTPPDTLSAVEATMSLALAADPKIDILINNAGTYIDQPFLELDFETFDRTMRLNVYAYFWLTQRFAKHWVNQGKPASVLLIGSINGRLAEPTHAAYDTSKGAVEMMVKTLCVSLAPHGIRVNGLAPGLFYTPLTASALDNPRALQWMKLHTPNGQVPGPEVCGEAAVYLVSDAARHVTGQMLLVDGGMSAWQQPDPPAS